MNEYDIVKAYEQSKTIPGVANALIKKGVDSDVAYKLAHVLGAAADKWEVDLSASRNQKCLCVTCKKYRTCQRTPCSRQWQVVCGKYE